MRRLLLFLSVLALFALVACQQDEQRQCSCGSLHDVPGSTGGTSLSAAESKIDGKAVVDGEGEAGVSVDNPTELTIYTRSPCPLADGGADDGGDAGDASEDAADASADASDAGDAGDGGARWTERVVVHLGALPTGYEPGVSIDLAEAGAYATALDPTTCAPIRIPLTGKAVTTSPSEYYFDHAWHVSARTPRTNARAVVIEANIFHRSAKVTKYDPTPASQECY